MKQRTLEKNAANQNGIKRLTFVALSVLFEVALIILFFTELNDVVEWISAGTRAVGLLVVFYIYGQHKTSSMKMPWIILILLFPIPGLVLYLLTGLNGSTRKMRREISKADGLLMQYLPKNDDIIAEIYEKNPAAGNIAKYLMDYAGYPAYKNTDIEYYSDAFKALKAQIEELKKAERFIFMEYHAIENKDSWLMIEEVLLERINAGVEVRVFYDDMGSIGFVNTDFENLFTQCREVTDEYRYGRSRFRRLGQMVLRLFAELM